MKGAMKAARTLRQAPATAARIEELESVEIEWTVRPVGAERVRQLLGDLPDAEADPGAWTFRSFQVRQVVPGRGAWVQQIHEHGGESDPIWIEDAEAAEYLEEGSLFGLSMRPDDRVVVPRFWRGCEQCERERARRRRRAR